MRSLRAAQLSQAARHHRRRGHCPHPAEARRLRGFVIGVGLIALVSFTVLSLRPGGLRRQLGYAARRLRLALILGGAYVLTSAVVRIAFPEGAVSDWGLPVLAVALSIVFLVLGQNPKEEPVSRT